MIFNPNLVQVETLAHHAARLVVGPTEFRYVSIISLYTTLGILALGSSIG